MKMTPMDQVLPTWQYVSTIKFAINASSDAAYNDQTQRVFALYADALIKSYRVDDTCAYLLK